MRKRAIAMALGLGLVTGAASAQQYTQAELIQFAIDANACPEFGVASAELQPDGTVLARCNTAAAAGLPGEEGEGLRPVAAVAVAFMAVLVASGSDSGS